jgi:hypothetical protein
MQAGCYAGGRAPAGSWCPQTRREGPTSLGTGAASKQGRANTAGRTPDRCPRWFDSQSTAMALIDRKASSLNTLKRLDPDIDEVGAPSRRRSCSCACAPGPPHHPRTLRAVTCHRGARMSVLHAAGQREVGELGVRRGCMAVNPAAAACRHLPPPRSSRQSGRLQAAPPPVLQERKNVEGPLFLVKRRTQPRFQLIVLNKMSAAGAGNPGPPPQAHNLHWSPDALAYACAAAGGSSADPGLCLPPPSARRALCGDPDRRHGDRDQCPLHHVHAWR